MGRFSTTVHIKDNAGKMKLINTFCEVMKKRGFVPCSEDEAALSYLLAFGEGGWVTLANEEYKDTPQKAYDDSREMAAALKTSAFSVEVVDSDFALLKLNDPNGGEDEVVVGDGSGYGIEEPTRGERQYWEKLLADGKTWEQFYETAAKNEVFVEDVLGELAEVLGIEPYFICADHDEVSEKADENKNITAFYFKKAAAKAKSLSLNAAFKQVFGEALEPLGFKLIKSKFPYFVRVVNDEIIHCFTVSSGTADGRGWNGVRYKCFNVYCGISTIYNSDINFNEKPKMFSFGFINEISEIYAKTHWFDYDMNYCISISDFYYDPTNNNSLIAALKRAFAAVETNALPVIGKAVTLEKCMDYFGLMKHYIYPTLDGSGESLLCTRLFSADEYVMFIDRFYCERELKELKWKINTETNLSSKMKDSIEARIKNIMEGREEGKKKDYEIFTNSELQEKAPAELERRKKENTELLRSYGLEI